MAIPPVSEQNVYDRAITTAEARVAITTRPRRWTGPMIADFSVDGVLDATEFWYTQQAGDHPLVSGGTLQLRMYGGAPRETVVTRSHWFPEDSTLAFEARARVTFPMTNPVYSAVLTFGGIEQSFGVEAEPMRVKQPGSRNEGDANVGSIFIDSAGVIETTPNARANDMLPHDYTCRWNPGAAQVPGDEILTVLFDGVIQYETSEPGFAVQPRYIQIGMIQSTRAQSGAPGDPESTVIVPGVPTVPIVVHELEVLDYLGGGYEADTQPSWTRPDLGNDIDTAADRERFVMDGEIWAKLPIDAVTSVTVEGGRDALNDAITIELAVPDPEDPENTPNRFFDMRWKRRTVVFDTRIRAEEYYGAPGPFHEPAVTEWRRQICAVIEDFTQPEPGKIILVGRDRISAHLDTFINASYINAEEDAEATGEPLANVGFLLGDILEDIVDVTDAVVGDMLGPVSTIIQAPEVLPQALSSGGESLLPVLTEWCDRLVLEVCRRYATTGDARYGQLLVNLWTGLDGLDYLDFGAGYDFVYAPFPASFQNIVAATLSDGRDGTGQSLYRQASPYQGNLSQSIESLPTVGQFPTFSYPVNARVASDSLASIESSALTPLLGFPRRDGSLAIGGVARHRYRRENVQRRVLTLTCHNHDWMEPTDPIFVDDSRIIDPSSDEFWVISNRSLRWQDGQIEAQITALTTDWVGAVVRDR